MMMMMLTSSCVSLHLLSSPVCRCRRVWWEFPSAQDLNDLEGESACGRKGEKRREEVKERRGGEKK
eukprot:568844-Hanusia_phi.AAC.1